MHEKVIVKSKGKILFASDGQDSLCIYAATINKGNCSEFEYNNDIMMNVYAHQVK